MIRRILAAAMSAAILTLGLVATSPAPAMAVGGWRIDSLPSGRCIAPVNNNTVDRNIALVLSNAPCRITWDIVAAPGTSRKFIKLDANSARCWVPSGSSQSPGVKIVTGACSNTAPFQWEPVWVSEVDEGDRDWYMWKNYVTGYCLTVDPPGTTAGAPLVQRPCQRGAHLQLFSW